MPRMRAEKTLVHHRIQCHAKFTVVVVPKRDKAEGLETTFRKSVHWSQHFSHTLNGTRTGLEHDFYEIALA